MFDFMQQNWNMLVALFILIVSTICLLWVDNVLHNTLFNVSRKPRWFEAAYLILVFIVLLLTTVLSATYAITESFAYYGII